MKGSTLCLFGFIVVGNLVIRGSGVFVVKKVGYFLFIIAAVFMSSAMFIGLVFGLLEVPFDDGTALESILVTLWIGGTLLIFLGLFVLLVKVIEEPLQNKEVLFPRSR